MEKFEKILEKYKILNPDRKIEGYTDEEIGKIERLYDIEVKGDFRKFLKLCGRHSGELIGEILIFYASYDIPIGLNYYLFNKNSDKKMREIVKEKPFVITEVDDIYYSFVKTKNDDFIVYNYNENDKKIEPYMTFEEYLLTIIKNGNPELKPVFDLELKADLLPRRDYKIGGKVSIKEIEKYLNDNNKKEKKFFEILKKYLEKNNIESIGYSEEEIKYIESFFELKSEGFFKEFLKLCGKSMGGLLDNVDFIFYKDYNLRKHWILNQDFSGKLQKNDVWEWGKDSDIFVISVKNDNYCYIQRRLHETKATIDANVRYYDEKENKVIDTGMDLERYLVSLVEEYNPNLELPSGEIKIRDILKI